MVLDLTHCNNVFEICDEIEKEIAKNEALEKEFNEATDEVVNEFESEARICESKPRQNILMRIVKKIKHLFK